jgi:hypothetical protein
MECVDGDGEEIRKYEKPYEMNATRSQLCEIEVASNVKC